MSREVVLLRGVNVGGSHRLSMSELRSRLEEVGCTDVATNGMGRAKLPVALEKGARKAESPAVGTTRNWNTVLKLVALAGAGD